MTASDWGVYLESRHKRHTIPSYTSYNPVPSMEWFLYDMEWRRFGDFIVTF